MSAPPVISVQNLSKWYRLLRESGGESTGGNRVRRMIGAPFHYLRHSMSPPSEADQFWALRDCSFEVKEGEVVGLVGHNGAGKSTLLKILSRITEPSTGRAVVRGRVGALLQVGTGFHPELTGRENLYLSGAILGMRRQEIDREFDAIVDFAQVERFLDVAVKRYSSGMYMRLAFAVAAHLKPDILVVDEVLAVGDAVFQRKCLGKMDEIGRQGRTVLFVSHNLVALQKLCTRALWLEKGKMIADGEPSDIVDQYTSSLFQSAAEKAWDDPLLAPADREARLVRVCVRPTNGLATDAITRFTPIEIEVEWESLTGNVCLDVKLQVFSSQNVTAFNASSMERPGWTPTPSPPGLYRAVCSIPPRLLNSGMHRVEILMIQDGATKMFRDEGVTFEVEDDFENRGAWLSRWGGAVRPALEWTFSHIREAPEELPALVGTASEGAFP